jgi:hypothetical protein
MALSCHHSMRKRTSQGSALPSSVNSSLGEEHTDCAAALTLGEGRGGAVVTAISMLSAVADLFGTGCTTYAAIC